MRDYILLNGVKSTTVKGLLIQSLPPITKPLMRTEIEEIDGRDGDIVTKLGYSAYDKTLRIGLFGDYDIDDVIRYFASEGTVTFSNEVDKFYYYTIIDQIDFEKLIRFREADVIFHVQPFKFSAVDREISLFNEFARPQSYTGQSNGILVRADSYGVSVSGTASDETIFMIPVDAHEAGAGTYRLSSTFSGDGYSRCSVRLIENIPSDDESFGEGAVPMADGSSFVTAVLASAKTYKYIWLYVESGASVDFEFDLSCYSTSATSMEVINRGNTFSKPQITIHGDGVIHLYINTKLIFIIDLTDTGWLTIDAKAMNAYKGDVLMNRHIAGDYKDLVFPTGRSILSWIGNVSDVVVSDFARWV